MRNQLFCAVLASGRLGFCLLGLILPFSVHAQLGLELFNPDWSIVIDDFGYADVAYDKRPDYLNREYLSGEWAGAIFYSTNDTGVGPTWLNPDFVFPDWVSNSDFGVVTPMPNLPATNAFGLHIASSIITNSAFGIRITSEMIDTTNGIPEGLTPNDAGPGSNLMSNRYVFRQRFAITNISGATLDNVSFYKFIHSLQAIKALYDDHDYGPTYNGHQYVVTQQGTELGANASIGVLVVHHDTVCLHANIAPGAWEVGRYGIEGIDSHSWGKPSVGVHLSVEAGVLSGTNWFYETNKWVSGALRCDLGTLESGACTNIEFLMSLKTVTLTDSPFKVNKLDAVVSWGNNSSDETNVPTSLAGVVALAAGSNYSLALLGGGTVEAWGDNTFGQTNVPPGLSGLTLIAAGSRHALARQSDGTVVAWGDNSAGQTNVPNDLTDVANTAGIAAGGSHSLARKNDGTVVAWGDNTFGQTNFPGGFTYVTDIAAGANHSLARDVSGAVGAWGDNTFGQTNVPPGLTALAIAAGANHNLALHTDGTVVAWGDNTFGQTNVPPNVTNAAAIAAGGNFSVALLDNGLVVAWGDNSAGQLNIPGTLTDVIAIAAGANHCLVSGRLFQLPALSIARNGDNAIVSWPAGPTVPGVGMGTIEESGAVDGANWNPLSFPAELIGTNFNVTIPMSPTNGFIRLRIPLP